MSRSLALCGSAIVLIVATAVEASAQDDSTSLNAEMDYAEWLEEQGEMYRSASSYLRVYRSATNRELRERAAIGVVRVHRRGERWKDTVLWGERFRGTGLSPTLDVQVALEVSQALLALDRSIEAARELEGIEEGGLSGAVACRRRLLLGFAHLARFDETTAREVWIRPEDPCGNEEALSVVLSEAAEIHKSSKFLAGTLALVPGAGYLVTGQKQTALATLVVNGLLIAGAVEAFEADLNFLGATFAIFAVGWYTGSIYGSVKSVDRVYEAHWSNMLGSVDLEAY